MRLPIQLAERLALALGALGLIVGLSLTWPMLWATLNQWLSGWARGFSQALPLAGSSLILAWTGALVAHLLAEHRTSESELAEIKKQITDHDRREDL